MSLTLSTGEREEESPPSMGERDEGQTSTRGDGRSRTNVVRFLVRQTDQANYMRTNRNHMLDWCLQPPPPRGDRCIISACRHQPAPTCSLACGQEKGDEENWGLNKSRCIFMAFGARGGKVLTLCTFIGGTAQHSSF